MSCVWDEARAQRRAPRRAAVLVGQAPSRTGRPDRALTGGAGQAIARAAGLDWPFGYLDLFDRVNLLETWPGPGEGRGDLFPIDQARAAARDLGPDLVGRVAVLLGRGVARAFGLHAGAAGQAWYSWWVLLPDYRAGPGCPGYVCWAHRDLHEARALAQARAHAGAFAAAVAPHPSRVSRLWNERAARDRAREWWTDLARQLARGAG